MKEMLKSILSGFDLGSLLPDLGELFGGMAPLLRLVVLVGPVCMLVLGLLNWRKPAPEANYHQGYRCYFGMGSVEAWLFTQKLAGMAWTGLGGVLTLVMFIRCWGLGKLSGYEAVCSAVESLFWELGLLVLSMLVINVVVAVNFDRNGNRREKK